MLTTVLDLSGLQSLVDALRAGGRRVIAPTPRGSAIVPAEITSVADLPGGVGDEQSPGRYRTVERSDDALFGFAAPAQSARPWLFPPDELLWRATRSDADPAHDRTPAAGGAAAEGDGAPSHEPLALLGIRSCDLAAIGIHDAVLRDRPATDVHYAARRADALLIAVTCANPAGTCFCDSMGTGPKPGPGADIVLTELLDDGRHRFLAEAASSAGEEVLAAVPGAPPDEGDHEAVRELVDRAVARMGRHLDTHDLRDLLYSSAESPRWAEVGQRCLACTNCTLVCPTCFCTTIEDVSDLSGETDERHRVWDSCFSLDHSRLHGGSVRTSTSSRYRQWLTHKLAAWIDQFGTSGCVGCGRCITWCPVGIDLTEEVAGLREDAARRGTRTGHGHPTHVPPAKP